MNSELNPTTLASIAAPIFATLWGLSAQTEAERPEIISRAIMLAKELHAEAVKQDPRNWLDVIKDAAREHR
jgi:hypothetical protein